MDKLLRPDRFDADPNSPRSSQEWMHWKATFENFISSVIDVSEEEKFKLLVNYVSNNIYELISDCRNYSEAKSILEAAFVKLKNEIFARHILMTKKQQTGENIGQYVQHLKVLSKDCNFLAVSADQNREDYIRDSFINGILSNDIRQRLLENNTITLQDAIVKAQSLESASKHSEAYTTPLILNWASEAYIPWKGHFSKVCRLQMPNSVSAAVLATPTSSSNVRNLAADPQCLSKSVTEIKVNGNTTESLIDTGSSESYISKNYALSINVKTFRSHASIIMASTALRTTISEHCFVNLEINEHSYKNVKLSIIQDLCADVVIGHDLLKQHSSLEITFAGSKMPLVIDRIDNICSLAYLNIEPPKLFSNLSNDCKPRATKSRKFSTEDKKFISDEIQYLLLNGIIEESNSPWRAQVLITKSETHKKRMVVDYSQTINKFTYLDAYPLPDVEDIVRKVARYSVFSSIDLKNAYHQIPIKNEEKIYTAFEANGQLYQFCRIPFGVTNGVACFQRVIDENWTLKPDPERLEPLKKLPLPNDSQSLKRAVGMFAHYSKFIPQFSEKIQKLVTCNTFPLIEQAAEAFQILKSEIISSAVTTIDDKIPFIVESDASDFCIAASLSQGGRPVAFFSRTLSKSERHHSSVEKEAYAIVEALRKWRHFLIDASLLDCVTGSESAVSNEQFIKDPPSPRLSICEENPNISPVNVLEDQGNIESVLKEENKDSLTRRGTRERNTPAYLKDFVQK
ncbi:uncharacterized protein [Diabrotica undecimpunctata]|uniref:uncharacterized protein n=1 Tax=Diabrotica undecimpunctata TaxID=50387 RepID=UPI003B636F0F